jgi:hypothetical protein
VRVAQVARIDATKRDRDPDRATAALKVRRESEKREREEATFILRAAVRCVRCALCAVRCVWCAVCAHANTNITVFPSYGFIWLIEGTGGVGAIYGRTDGSGRSPEEPPRAGDRGGQGTSDDRLVFLKGLKGFTDS